MVVSTIISNFFTGKIYNRRFKSAIWALIFHIITDLNKIAMTKSNYDRWDLRQYVAKT
jgi:hypothetical protein